MAMPWLFLVNTNGTRAGRDSSLRKKTMICCPKRKNKGNKIRSSFYFSAWYLYIMLF